jgi:hypothetical protein
LFSKTLGDCVRQLLDSLVKAIEDQFGFIAKASGDIRRLSLSLHEALMPGENDTA